jgi:hypothetical protein
MYTFLNKNVIYSRPLINRFFYHHHYFSTSTTPVLNIKNNLEGWNNSNTSMSPSQHSAEDSQLISDLVRLSKKSPKLCRLSVYPAPAAPNTLIRSWKMNEFKYYDIPSPFPTLARGLFTTEIEPDSVEQEGKHRIVARGYDKFFNIGEVPWTTVREFISSSRVFR